MRCLYCGGLNRDNALHCAYCGRSFPQQGPAIPPPPLPQRPPVQQPQRPTVQPPAQQPQRPTMQQPRRPVAPRGVPAQAPTYQPSGQPMSAPSRPAAPTTFPNGPATRQEARRPASVETAPPATDTTAASAQVAPEAPVAFPPRTIDQLKALQREALAYSVLDETVNYGRKKIVQIVFPRCPAWQQVATLLKALAAFRSEKLDTVVIQGLFEHSGDVYAFNNGQLQFDQNVRLGSQTLNRYQIDTENGFSSNSVRIVLTE